MDFGVTGLDLVLETQADVVQCAALPFGFCRLSLAAKPGVTLEDLENATVATSFPRLTTEFFKEKGIRTDVIELSGAVETSVRLGVADAVVDLVQTGRTLKENGLVALEDVLSSSAVFISNKNAGKPGWLYA
ncbi:ATP phosphoribosyltransferase [Candidatus Micrarchaeota archaeon]|nr:ATP phosphoribosyltransferase [Candidatus Micrarchaeota archaeon]